MAMPSSTFTSITLPVIFEETVALRRAVPSDWVSINEIGPGPGDHWAIVVPPLPASAHETFGRLAHQNPLVAYMTDGARRGSAARLSDVTSPEEFRRLEIYRELYGPLGLEHQIAFTLPEKPPRLLGVALSRREHDFDDGERDLLNGARPFLIQAYRNAVAFESERRTGEVAMLAALTAAGLSPREAAVIALIARGNSSADAAAALGIGVRTVDKHLQHAYAKLDVGSRSQAAARAWELTRFPSARSDSPSRPRTDRTGPRNEP